MSGMLITLEGIDGCGKSTQREMLGRALEARGLDPVITREPGGTRAGERIRALLSDATEKLAAETELFLIVAARAEHVAEVIRPAVEAGRAVISDRYTDSTIAFQGYGRGLPLATIDEMNRFATGGLAPDLTILFDLDPLLARSRLAARRERAPQGAADREITRFDDEQSEFHARVRTGYLNLARDEPERIRVVDASLSVSEAHKVVLSLVLPLLGA